MILNKQSESHEPLGVIDICAKAAKVDRKLIQEVAGFASQRNASLIETLVSRGIADEYSLIRGLAESLKIPFLAEEIEAVDNEALSKISPSLAISYDVIPVGQADGRLQVAIWDPFDWQTWDDLAQIVRFPMEKYLCPRSLIKKMIKEHYGIGADTVDHLVSKLGDSDLSLVQDRVNQSDEEAANEPSVVRLVNQIIIEGVHANATDIHFEPCENSYRIRYRVDGMLEDISISESVNILKSAVVSRVKIMSGLDITEKRLPQDGRAEINTIGHKFDLRVSILPGIHGEAIAIRIQNRQVVKMELDALGFDEKERKAINKLANRSHGLILVTGPTGSGKTTTLYTCLGSICRPETKIITIEDPVEYWLDGLLQMQIREEIGFTFAKALRSMLRHDPDVMLVGEIRDRETADVAVRSALTGHLVFATLHTNDAASAAARLCELGIEPFLVASSVSGVLAQRLIRKLCSDCRIEISIDALSDYEKQILSDSNMAGQIKLLGGKGCKKCRFTGYRGRMAVGEVLKVTPAIRGLIQQRKTSDVIGDVGRQEGMRSLSENAMLALRQGKTTISEVLRIMQEDL